MSQVLLICNGENPGKSFVKEQAEQANFIIAADGGANTAYACGVTPDVVIGDLDSVEPKVKKHFKNASFLQVDNPNNTDFEKALDYLVSKKYKECAIVCATGKRLDFTIGNLLSVYPYLKRMQICFKSPKWEIYPLAGGKVFHAAKGARVSVLPITPVKELSLKGLQYKLDKLDWNYGQTGLGLSNIVKNKKFEVTFKKGFLLLYLELSEVPAF